MMLRTGHSNHKYLLQETITERSYGKLKEKTQDVRETEENTGLEKTLPPIGSEG